VHAAFFGKSEESESGALSAFAIRKRVVAYLAENPEHGTKVKEKHPEFFFGAAFARLLREWSRLPQERGEFFYIRERRWGKNIAFLSTKCKPEPMSSKMTQTEKTAQALIGKTFVHFYQGEEIALGIVIGMVGPNAVQFELAEGDREWHEIQAVTDLGFDRIAKTGYQFSKGNPFREKLAD
jgi:hypothetical protein